MTHRNASESDRKDLMQPPFSRFRKIGGVVVSTTLLIAGAPIVATAEAASEPPPMARPAGPPHTVTLITGDRIIVSGDGNTASFPPGGARRNVRYSITRERGHIYLVPTDAMTLIASGRIDRRLFDLTGLIEAGYDDSRTGKVPLIMTGSIPAALSQRSGIAGSRRVGAVTAASVRKSDAREAWKVLTATGSGVRKLWLDGKRKVSLDQSVPQIGAPAAWQAGLSGKGARVAVLDSGIDATHPDLAGRIGAAQNFTMEPAGDQVGHGTHVASTVAGSGAASGGRYRGVAPDATLLDGKVCELNGCAESAVLAGMQWAAVDQHADVINVSLGGQDTAEVDPLEEAVNRLTAQTGVLFVIASGNAGPMAGTVSSPGSADAALTVGAVDKQDALAEFSGRGPGVGGGVKPDVTAPGVGIVAAKAKDGQIGEPVGDSYVRLDGTSMATPHVAGAAALLAQQHPDWSGTELKAALVATAARQQGQSIFDQGAGRVDVARVVSQQVVPDQANLSFGVQQWPHQDDQPAQQTLTYRNLSQTAVELNLSAELTDPDGKSAPEGAIYLSSDRLTVPAAGTASVTVSISTNHNGPDGAYAGVVVARSGDRSVTTLVGVGKEAESYNLTIKHLDDAGSLTANASSVVIGIDRWSRRDLTSPTGMVRLRLPKGRFLLHGLVETSRGTSLLVQPTVDLAADTTIEVDARLAKPFSVTLPDRRVRTFSAVARYFRSLGGEDWMEGGMGGDDLTKLSSAQIGAAAPPGELVSYLQTGWGVPGAAGDFVDSPVRYDLLDRLADAFYTGYRRTVRSTDLAKMKSRYAAQLPGRFMLKGHAPIVAESPWAFGYTIGLTKPQAVTEYFEGRSTPWLEHVSELELSQGLMLAGQTRESRIFEAGRAYAEDWNFAVLGPHLRYDFSAARYGDIIQTGISLFADRAGHSGWSTTDSAVTRLYRDGVLAGESDEPGSFRRGVEVTPGRARFRLETTAERSTFTPLSSKVEAAWTFESDTASEDGESLPLWAIRFQPDVDLNNQVEAGALTTLPFEVLSTPEAKVGTLAEPTVEVSGDGGRTWHKAAVTQPSRGKFRAVVATPPDAAVLSLRAKAADSDGNTVEQTIIGAYGLR